MQKSRLKLKIFLRLFKSCLLSKTTINSIIISFIIIATSFLAVFIFMKQAFINDFEMNATTGVIGDTIGGITSPIIGLISAILIYITFNEQVKANRELNIRMDKQETQSIKDKAESVKNFQKEEQIRLQKAAFDLNRRNYDIAYQILTQIKNDFNKLEFENKRGVHALSEFTLKLDLNKNSTSIFLQDFLNIIFSYKLLLNRLKGSSKI